MAQTTDSLRLKVSAAEYRDQIDKLDKNIKRLNDILTEYQNLQGQIATKVLGEADSNIATLQKAVQKNIKYVEGQLKMLQENRAMLQKQNDALAEGSRDMTSKLDDAVQKATSDASAIKIIADTVG